MGVSIQGAGGMSDAAPRYRKFSWVNADVVALGAVLSGELTAFTLVAREVVRNAYIEITGQGAGPTTLTVSVGRTGPAYIDLILAQTAKVAAGTLYGGAAAHRGALLGFDVPSLSATTAVKIQFIGTVANLSTVTGSTGNVIIETAVLP